MNYLKVEGYVPKLDTDGDIAFKVSGTSHYIRIYDGNDNGFCYLELFCLYNKENATLDRVAYTANNTNQSYKQVRVSYSQVDGTEGEFKILFETPSFISTGEEFNKLLPEYLECIDSASDHFFEIYDFE